MKIIDHSDLFVVQSTMINLSLYWNEFPFQIDPILQGIRLNEGTAEKLLVGVSRSVVPRILPLNVAITNY